MKFAATLLMIGTLIGSTASAEELTQRDLAAFSAKIDAAISRRDVDAIIEHIAEHAVISATVNEQGQTRTLRMNKSQYGQWLTAAWASASSYEYVRSNEKITIQGDQAIVTADISESIVVQGQTLNTKTRERATVENYDGHLILTQLVANQVL